MGNVQAKVRCGAAREDVYDFLCGGGGTKLKMVQRDPVAYRVTLRSGEGVLSRGDEVECTVSPAQGGCTVLLDGKATRENNVPADVRGTVNELATSLILRFGGK